MDLDGDAVMADAPGAAEAPASAGDGVPRSGERIAWQAPPVAGEAVVGELLLEAHIAPEAEGYDVARRGLEAVLAAAHASVHGGSLPERRTTAVNDTRYYGLYFDIPGLCYGPKGEGAHAFDERTSIEDLRKCTLTMATFIANWCGLSPRA
jgi:acetylornithine deacetylase/succinyl-diaminopimelate desuccinylase-like protein